MHEPSDGLAEEVERQLQLALATGAVVARRAVAARQQALAQAQRESEQTAAATHARIDAERLLAAERLRPVFDSAWWDTASPQEIAGMWQQANSWREPQRDSAPETIFDRASGRIREEVRQRTGLDPSQVAALAAVQELEHEAMAVPARQPGDVAQGASKVARRFDEPQRREQLRARLRDAGVPETAIAARTLADVGQGREAEHATHMPVRAGAEPGRMAARRPPRERQRQR